MRTQGDIFPPQVDLSTFVTDNVYWISSTAVLIALLALCMIDAGFVRRKNVLDSCVQKIVGFFIGALGFSFVGFGFWNWQFYEALGVSNSLGAAIQDWWLGGTLVDEFAQSVDPSVASAVDNSQIFFVFLAIYGGFVCALLHFAGSERLKARAYYIICAAVGTIAYPFLLWLTWGSTSPLTNNGTHDLVGIFCAYLFVGILGVMLAHRVGPRAGMFTSDARSGPWAPHNPALGAFGVVLLLVAIPLVVVGCGYIVPGEGYYGISMTTSSIGVTLMNTYMAFIGGSITGAIMGYYTHNALYLLLGPLAGYLSGAAMFDVLVPWKMLLVALAAPLVLGATYKWLVSRKIDESKIVPLASAALYGVVVTSLLAWGTPTGGYFGITQGTYAFQSAEINLWWQLIGVGSVAVVAVVMGLVFVYGLDKVMGLRVSADAEAEGLDAAYWAAHKDEAAPAPVGTDSSAETTTVSQV